MGPETQRKETASPGMKGLEGKYLTFSLGSEEYGIGILNVREIIGLLEVTAVPHTPPYIKGVINLRGRVIPVVDLRLKFGMPSVETTERTCIIVVEVNGRSGPVQVGMLVDSVSEVLNIAGQDIESALASGTAAESESILGMAKVRNEVKILLDVDQMIGTGDLDAFEEA
jgi:purine-binding chemotaxis protein CheW